MIPNGLYKSFIVATYPSARARTPGRTAGTAMDISTICPMKWGRTRCTIQRPSDRWKARWTISIQTGTTTRPARASPTSCCVAPCWTPRRRRRRAEGPRPCALRGAHGRVSWPARSRHDPDLRRQRRPRRGREARARDLLRVPVDLDLGEAYSREEAQDAYAAQARTLRDALQAADTVLAIWRGPLRTSPNRA